MNIYSKRNIILPGPSGEKFRLNKGCEAAVPAWAEDSSYLKALERDGKVILSASSSDKDFAANGKKPKKPAKPSKEPAKPSKEPDEPSKEEQPDGHSGEAPEGAS